MWGSRHRLALFLGRTDFGGLGLDANGRARRRSAGFSNLLGFNRQTMCDRRSDAQQQDSKDFMSFLRVAEDEKQSPGHSSYLLLNPKT